MPPHVHSNTAVQRVATEMSSVTRAKGTWRSSDIDRGLDLPVLHRCRCSALHRDVGMVLVRADDVGDR
ncbi:MAG TPA: hypothetical protein EYH02_05860 [Ignisphaera aggregans]|uniref:Uncharacterized protein n=1 Tax=Ignisphaera aggregans TaxID=334771 RepID=A0A832YZT4_9CREN|nr:hypothetical protein [Ignisphaera aggregans]